MVRILFVTQDDPFYIPLFFDEFIKIFDDEVYVEGVVIQPPLGKRSLTTLFRQMLDFYGPIDFVKIGLQYTLYKVLNIIAVTVFRGQFPGVFSLKHLLLKHRWNVLNVNDVNDPTFINMVKSRNLDLIMSVAASQIFKSEILSMPKYGCINIHNSRLPKNRGMLPNFYALYNYDREPNSAMTVHRMNKRLDDGEIILQEEFALDPKESLHRLIMRTKRFNAHLALRAIKLFKNGEPQYLPNDSSRATYNTFPTKEDVKKFRAKGLRLV